MEILYLCPEIPFPIYKNGRTLINYHLLKNLSKKHEIDLITFYSPDYENYKKDISKICNEHFLVKREKSMNSLKRRILSLKKGFPGIAIDLSNKMKSKLISISKIKKYDLIYYDSLSTGMYATFINNNIPKIIAPHDSLSMLCKTYSKSTSNILKKFRCNINVKMLKKFEKEIYSYFNACIFVSEKDAKYVKSFTPDSNIYAIPNGVDLKYYYPNKDIAVEKNTIIFTGVMNYEPNVVAIRYFVKKIFSIILNKLPDVKLYVVGKNPTKDIENLNNSKNIIVTGYVDDIRDYVWKSEIFISPLISGAGIKNKILQAMAMGKPIVATGISCDGINVESGIDIMITDGEKNFAQTIINLIGNNVYRDNIGKCARKTVELNYSWEKICMKYEKLMRNFII